MRRVANGPFDLRTSKTLNVRCSAPEAALSVYEEALDWVSTEEVSYDTAELILV